ncbi:MAG: YegS/Rv2252/BmrU family lipid kinase [Oscillospiraceae bacterium]|nr:YegS/Rv2252/BmrU family lipid kinase [Oscillospiraceae bacterium]
MRHLFIINPAAGKKKSTAALEKLLSKLSFPHEVMYTQKAGDAEEFARRAAQTGEEVRIYACGGDGTLNEVVNGAAAYPNAAVTCVPKGTGNDFLKIFGPNYREQFFDLEELAVGPQTPFDLIDCNGKLGIDVVCCGIDARIGAGVHRYKKLFGPAAYVVSLVEQVLLRGINRPMRGVMGDHCWDDDTALICVCNGRHYGGGFNPVPEAMPDDGVLDMLLIPKINLPTLARVIGRYAAGRYKELPHLVRDYHGQSVTFSSSRPLTAVVDGEVVEATRFTIGLSDKKINFFYPACAGYSVENHTPAATF